ncbi:MAG: DinB family protein [Chloroflexota bacterium]|nr:DinB family protein [Chloroflexota bacterium]
MPQSEQGDTSVLAALFKHNAWANLKLLDFCEGLSDSRLDATAIGCFGSIRDTLVHIDYSEADYVNLVNDKWPAVPPEEDRFTGFAVLKDAVGWAGDELLQLAISARADTIVRVERPGEPIFEYPLAGFMVQVLNHSTEHRTQISTIITQLGLEPPAMTGWKYMREMGELHEYEEPSQGE